MSAFWWLVLGVAVCAYTLRRLRWRAAIDAQLTGPPIPVNTRSVRTFMGSVLMAHIWSIVDAPRVPHTERPDVMTMFTELARKSAAKGEGIFRLFAFHPLTPIGSCLCVVHDPALVKEMLSRKHFGGGY